MFIGRAKGGRFGVKETVRVYVEIELKDTEKGPALRMCGEIWHRRQLIECGQNYDTLMDMLDKGEFTKLNVPGSQLRALIAIWDRWHLNDMSPYCVHQAARVRELYELGLTDPDEIRKDPIMACCPECGHRYGSKWCYIPIPRAIVEWLKNFMATYG